MLECKLQILYIILYEIPSQLQFLFLRKQDAVSALTSMNFIVIQSSCTINGRHDPISEVN